LGLPYEFWEEATIYRIYAYNRCYLSKIGMTLCEVFYRAKPDISNLRIFVSLASFIYPRK
jgi:hypothetical protein